MAPMDKTLKDGSPTRRAILTAGLGAAAATVVSALERAAPVRAANGDPLVIGTINNGTTTTQLLANNSGVNFFARSTGAVSGVAVEGESAGSNGTGVSGYASGTGGTTGVGASVTSADGVALRAYNAGGGLAILAAGAIRYSWSGKATIGAGKAKKILAFPGVDSTSLVFAVLANNRSSRWVRAVVPAGGYFTIYLNGTVASDTKVSWFILDRWV